MTITSLYGTAEGVPVRRLLTDAVAQSSEVFEVANGTPPTAVVYVLMDDAGTFRVGWETNSSSLPGAAALGIAVRGLLSEPRP
jgi:hypothetical protein